MSGSVSRRWLFGLLALLVFLPSVRAELPPLPGKFEGVYRRDPWGVGHFSHFLVPPKLHATFAPFEGKLIRVDVTDMGGGFHGPAVVAGVAKIERLPEPAVRVRWRLIPNKPMPGQPFQVVAHVMNRGKKPVEVGRGVSHPYITVHRPKLVARPDERSLFGPGYTNAQLSTEIIRDPGRPVVGQAAPLTDSFFCGAVVVPPGGEFPFALRVLDGLPAGKYELEVGGYTATGILQVGCHAPLVIAAGDRSARAANRLKLVKHEWARDGEGYHVTAKLVPADPTRPVQAARLEFDPRRPGERWATKMSARTAKREPVALAWKHDADYPHVNGKWRMAAIPAGGGVVTATLQKASRFDSRPIESVALQVLTANGVEVFDVSGGFVEDVPPATPFGPELGGVKLRIRPQKSSFAVGKPIRFFAQAVNVGKKPIVWWSSPVGQGRIARNVTMEIDGKAVELPKRKPEYIYGWAADHTCTTPQEWNIEIPATALPAAKGRHTLVYKVSSEPGKYTNTIGQAVPVLNGTLVSNEAIFLIE